jgi:hypothetical protein
MAGRKEILVAGPAGRAGRQMQLCPGKPVTDRKEILVIVSACPAGRQMPSHRGALLPVQRANDVRTQITAPFDAALAHLFPFCTNPGGTGQ